MNKKLFLILPMILILNACTSMNREFSCNAESGVGCASISEVNAMVNNGELTTEGANSSEPDDDNDNTTLPRTIVLPTSDNIVLAEAQPQRVSEIAMAIWIAPYTDKNDNFHSGEMVHTVVKEGHWEY